MNYSALALVFGLLQTVTVLLLVADKWVHRVTGGKSLEARINDLEQRIEEIRAQKIGESIVQINEHLRNTDANVTKLERRRDNR